MAFQPKFVDLVRNYSTTSGTDDFVLGPAVNGYVDFSAACQAGDSFYYSALGVDIPAETEVGRGTLLPGGKIARDPIGGAKTNFSSGTKSIALIAAAEWFDTSHQLIDSATQALADRAALAAHSGSAAFLRESGREGSFVFDGADHSTFVAADTAQGLYVAPASDPTGASGAWVRKFDGPVNARWFGLVDGDDRANAAINTAAFSAMLAALEARRDPYPASFQNCIERILIPYGVYWFGDAGAGAAIDLTSAVILEGHSVGYGDAAPILKFAAGVSGIRVQVDISSGANTKDVTPHNGAQGTQIRNLALCGDFSGVEAEVHGVVARTVVRCENVLARNFEGDGFHIAASTSAATGDNPPYGNANMSAFVNCSANGNRCGIYFGGTDANACTIVNFNANSNRQAGVYDSSFLGNSYFGGQFAINGATPYNDGVNVPVSVVSHNGNFYGCIVAQESGASANPPTGTTQDNAWWYYIGPGAPIPGIPAWAPGILTRVGGPIIDDQVTSTNVFNGIYAENSDAKAQIGQRSIVIGGFLAYWIYNNPAANRGTALLRGGNNGTVETDTCFIANSGTVSAKLGTAQANPSSVILNASEPTYSPAGHQLRFANLTGGALILTYNNVASANTYAFSVSGPGTTETFGSLVAQPHTLYAPRLAIGAPTGGTASARRIWVDNGRPAFGDHGVGEVCFRKTAAQSDPFADRCVAAGNPGTWQSIYSGYGTNPIGYSAGAGGAVAQTTSKSTGVTLSRLSGQITMNAAALAAGAIASFVLTNSQIAAGDVLVLNHVSGGTAGAYSLNAQSAAGSATINVRNDGGGALSEAIVIAFAVIKAVSA